MFRWNRISLCLWNKESCIVHIVTLSSCSEGVLYKPPWNMCDGTLHGCIIWIPSMYLDSGTSFVVSSDCEQISRLGWLLIRSHSQCHLQQQVGVRINSSVPSWGSPVEVPQFGSPVEIPSWVPSWGPQLGSGAGLQFYGNNLFRSKARLSTHLYSVSEVVLRPAPQWNWQQTTTPETNEASSARTQGHS